MTDRETAIPEPGLQGLERAARRADESKPSDGLPPVHLWNPPDCGNIDMRIAADGTWFYSGTPIARPAMVRLFSTILRRDGARYVLVSPVEKFGITVDDAPFVATRLERTGSGEDQSLNFCTNVEDWTEAGPAHPLRVVTDPGTGTPRPYVHVRGGLEALIARSVFYELVELAEPREEVLGLWSRGVFFPLGPLPAGWS